MAREEQVQGARSDTERHEGSSASSVADQAKETASQVGEQAQEQVTSQLDQQKRRAAEQLGSMSSALRQTSDNLREEDSETMAGYMENVARQVDRFSDYLRRRSVRDLYNEAENYARREPSMFIGGALLAGFLGARFLRSSSSQRRRREQQSTRRPSTRMVGEAERHHRRPTRPTAQEGRGYTQVHGTEGAEMPDPERGSSSTTSASSSSSGSSPTPSTQGTERETRH